MTYPDKYQTLLDDQVWAFIKQTEAHYPPNTTDMTILEQRTVYNTMCRAFFAKYPADATSSDGEITANDHAIPFRQYSCSTSEAKAEVIYFHGGGFFVGGLESHDDICAEICSQTGFNVTSVDYRLAPENVFPSDFEDAVAAFRHVATITKLPIVMVGDSAGGNLAASVCHAMRGADTTPVGQVLIYPGLGSSLTRPSYVEHAYAPMLSAQDCRFYADQRTGGNKAAFSDKRCFPLEDNDFSGLPPSFVFSAQCDPLRDDGSDYCVALLAAGNNVQFLEEPGLVHGYLRARHSVTKAKVSFDRIVRGIKLLATRQWIDNPDNL